MFTTSTRSVPAIARVLARQIQEIGQVEAYLADGGPQPARIRRRLVDAGDAELARARAVGRRHPHRRPHRDPLLFRDLPRHQHRRQVIGLGLQGSKAEKQRSKGEQHLA